MDNGPCGSIRSSCSESLEAQKQNALYLTDFLENLGSRFILFKQGTTREHNGRGESVLVNMAENDQLQNGITRGRLSMCLQLYQVWGGFSISV